MARQRKVAFTEDAAARIAKATLAYERGNRNQSAIKFRQVSDDVGIRLGKTSAPWDKGSLADIELYESGPANAEESSGVTLTGCVNKFGDVESNRWVAVASGPGGRWYLIAAEC